MIDVHVLAHEGTTQAQLDRCLRSLRDEACTVHVVDNAGHPVGHGRAVGYSLGSHPFVSYVDSDDEVVPGTYARLAKELEIHRAVCTLERVITEASGYVCPTPVKMHSVIGVRREDTQGLLPRMAEADWCADILVREALRPTQLDWLGGIRYVRDGTASSKVTPSQYRKECELWRMKTGHLYSDCSQVRT